MNSYSLSADSRRWWWPSAVAGTAGSAAIAAILVLPGAVQAVPEPVTPGAPVGSVVIGDTTYDRQCFLLRSPWNEALDGFQPRCPSHTTVRAPEGVRRPGIRYLP